MDMKDVKLVVFDLDYTLVDSGDGIAYCFNETRKWAGEPEIDPEKIKKRIGNPIEETFSIFGSAEPEKMRDHFRKLAREGAMRERSFLLDGVSEMLNEVKKRGYRMAVASTKSRPEIVSIMEHLGVDGYFEEYVGSDEVKSAKPSPDPLLLMMEKTGVAANDMVYVGDHIVDIQAARAAGVRVIAVAGGPIEEDEVKAEGPDAFIEKIGGTLLSKR